MDLRLSESSLLKPVGEQKKKLVALEQRLDTLDIETRLTSLESNVETTLHKAEEVRNQQDVSSMETQKLYQATDLTLQRVSQALIQHGLLQEDEDMEEPEAGSDKHEYKKPGKGTFAELRERVRKSERQIQGYLSQHALLMAQDLAKNVTNQPAQEVSSKSRQEVMASFEKRLSFVESKVRTFFFTVYLLAQQEVVLTDTLEKRFQAIDGRITAIQSRLNTLSTTESADSRLGGKAAQNVISSLEVLKGLLFYCLYLVGTSQTSRKKTFSSGRNC